MKLTIIFKDRERQSESWDVKSFYYSGHGDSCQITTRKGSVLSKSLESIESMVVSND